MSAAVSLHQVVAAPDHCADWLHTQLRARTAVIAVLGLGHVGLPLARTIARAGFSTIGFDVDAARIAEIGAASEQGGALLDIELRALAAAGRLRTSAAVTDLAQADVFVICVPTPLGADRQPDLRHVEAAARSVARQCRPGCLVVLESTSWPGTTRQVVLPILEAAGLRCGEDLFVAFSPEREDPGNGRYDTASIPKLVAGLDAASQSLALAFYGAVVDRVVPTETAEVAEAAKLVENVFRAVNIGLANELKAVFAALEIDVWQVMEAAATKPFGFMPFWPGPGVGGHCIPVDPVYLTWAARRSGVQARLIELALQVNAGMPDGIADRVCAALVARGRPVRGARVLVLGVGYKRNQGDVRDSPGLRILGALEAAGAAVEYFDPLVPRIPAACGDAGRVGVAWSPRLLAGFDAAVIATDHTRVDYATLVECVPIVVDTRNVCARLGLRGAGVVSA